MSTRQLIWWRILVIVIFIFMIFGLMLVFLPDLTTNAFSLLMYSSATRFDSFGQEAIEYIKLVHAVLGAVMFGWGALFLLVALGPLRQGARNAWWMFIVSLIAWYVPDTTFSLLSGFWQNVILNTFFALFFAVPLIAISSGTKQKRA